MKIDITFDLHHNRFQLVNEFQNYTKILVGQLFDDYTEAFKYCLTNQLFNKVHEYGDYQIAIVISQDVEFDWVDENTRSLRVDAYCSVYVLDRKNNESFRDYSYSLLRGFDIDSIHFYVAVANYFKSLKLSAELENELETKPTHKIKVVKI